VFLRADRSKMLIAVMVTIALLAVAIPTCQMIGCTMMCGGMMRISTLPGPWIGAACGGTWVGGGSQAATVPNGSFSALIALLAALGAAVLLMFSPNRAARLLFVAEANAPPPPLDPRGERHRL
jgi:hypothetical protein